MYKEIGIENIIGGLLVYNIHQSVFHMKDLKIIADSIHNSDEFVRIRSILESIKYIKNHGCVIDKDVVTIPESMKDCFIREYYKVDRYTREIFWKLARKLW